MSKGSLWNRLRNRRVWRGSWWRCEVVPFLDGLGTLLAGVTMLIVSILLFTRTIGEHDLIFGVVVGFNLILGGLSTLWLRWTADRNRSCTAASSHSGPQLRKSDPRPAG